MQLSEYDAFGPWIYEIDATHQIPSVFENYIDREADPVLMIKIPVKKERRNIKPGMVMYDQMVCMYRERMDIAQYADGSVKTIQIPYNSIAAIENSITLLYGKFSIFTTTGMIDFEYNTVSKEIADKLATAIREKLPVKDRKISLPGGGKERELSFFFNNLWDRTKETEDNLHIAAYQPEILIDYTKPNVFLNAYKMMFHPILRASLHLYNDREFIVIYRGSGIKSRNKVDYNYKYLYVPFDRISSVSLKDTEKYSNIAELSIHSNIHTFTIMVEKGNAEFDYINQFS